MTTENASAVATEYFRCIRQQDLTGIVALFAKSASCVMPDGRSFSGEAAVREWFTKLFAAQKLSPQVKGLVAEPSAISVEIENQLPDGTKRTTANFFYLDGAGLIEHMRVYRQG